MVYGNFLRRTADLPWRKEPLIVCDGGPFFFGVVYDAEAHQITDLAFNGAI